ncbi:Hypothetical_protein [Hexamita inflata]|uniref:Hypothetical_protein n=1 Tax=Hexamita inflata TaxID=28002 RepID=A0AA86PU35_9EUKA|nr:Hypothetical protein HINF_LOCUS31812 [Hexamita inflata]
MKAIYNLLNINQVRTIKRHINIPPTNQVKSQILQSYCQQYSNLPLVKQIETVQKFFLETSKLQTKYINDTYCLLFPYKDIMFMLDNLATLYEKHNGDNIIIAEKLHNSVVTAATTLANATISLQFVAMIDHHQLLSVISRFGQNISLFYSMLYNTCFDSVEFAQSCADYLDFSAAISGKFYFQPHFCALVSIICQQVNVPWMLEVIDDLFECNVHEQMYPTQSVPFYSAQAIFHYIKRNPQTLDKKFLLKSVRIRGCQNVSAELLLYSYVNEEDIKLLMTRISEMVQLQTVEKEKNNFHIVTDCIIDEFKEPAAFIFAQNFNNTFLKESFQYLICTHKALAYGTDETVQILKGKIQKMLVSKWKSKDEEVVLDIFEKLEWI